MKTGETKLCSAILQRRAKWRCGKRFMQESYSTKSIAGAAVVVLFILICLPSTAEGQRVANSSRSLGYDLSFGRSFARLASSIPELDKLAIDFDGATLGATAGNSLGKVKANAGLYYSSASTPYEFDLVSGNVSGSIYLLRIGGDRYHTIEPYFLAALSRQSLGFYGSYLEKNNSINYSSSQAPLLGRLKTTQLRVGLGSEYQLTNRSQFVHLFTEVGFGVAGFGNATKSAFDNTYIQAAVFANLGISFGRSY